MLISVTASASPRKGFTEGAVVAMMDIFDDVLAGNGSQEKLDRMMRLLESGTPVTTAMVRTAKSVVPAKRTMSDVTDAYWRRQQQAKAHSAAPAKQRQRPEPEPAERPEATTSIDEKAIYARWNSPKKAGSFGGVRPAPVRGSR
jgi:hypothetical protein